MKWIIIISNLFLYGCTHNHDGIHTDFLTPVHLKCYKDYEYKVDKDIKIIVDDREFFIKKGFNVNLKSIPKKILPLFKPFDASLIKSMIVHSWFYEKTCDFTRKQTDLIFYHMLINEGIPASKASILYYTVRLFGKKFYNEDYCE